MNKTKLADMTGLPGLLSTFALYGYIAYIKHAERNFNDRARFDESDFGIFPIVTSFEKNGDTGMRRIL